MPVLSTVIFLMIYNTTDVFLTTNFFDLIDLLGQTCPSSASKSIPMHDELIFMAFGKNFVKKLSFFF